MNDTTLTPLERLINMLGEAYHVDYQHDRQRVIVSRDFELDGETITWLEQRNNTSVLHWGAESIAETFQRSYANTQLLYRAAKTLGYTLHSKEHWPGSYRINKSSVEFAFQVSSLRIDESYHGDVVERDLRRFIRDLNQVNKLNTEFQRLLGAVKHE